MPKKVEPLTAAKFASLCKPRASRFEIGDGTIRGLRLRVLPNGRPTWLLTVLGNHRYQRVTFGDGMGLADARREAERLRGDIKQGADPTQEKRDAKVRAFDAAKQAAREAAREMQTLGALVSGYFTTGDGAGLRTRKEQERCIRVVFAEAMALPAAQVTGVSSHRAAGGICCEQR
jgi:Arm domain-containing DNA-binding protein